MYCAAFKLPKAYLYERGYDDAPEAASSKGCWRWCRIERTLHLLFGNAANSRIEKPARRGPSFVLVII